MAFRVKNANYNALRKLNLRERLAAANDSSMGQTLIQILSPTQISDLFPRYWIEKNPNISGFLKAIPSSMSAAKQKAYEEQIQNTASGAAAGANYDAGGYRKKWQQEMDNERQRTQVTKRFESPLPQLSPEQKQAFESLKAGDIGVNDDRVKFLKNISDADLTRAGLTRIKDDKGESRYHYQAPQVSEQQARESLATGQARGTGAWAKDVAFMKEVNRVSNKLGIKPNDLLSVMAFESGIDAQRTNSIGATGLIQFMPGTAKELGTTTEQLRGMTRAEQMKYVESYLIRNGIKPGATAADIYSKVFLPRRSNEYVLTTRGEKYYEQNRGLDVDGDGRITKDDLNRAAYGAGRRLGVGAEDTDALTQNYTPQQIAARQREIQSSIEAGRLGELAAITQPGGPTNASGTVGVNQQGKWESLNLYKGGSGHGYCAKGVVQVVKQLYQGNKFFDGRSVDGNGHAFQHKDGSFFTSSGLYNSSRPMSEDEISLAKAGKLPPGTVVVTQGGKDGVYGHIQIMGNGQWLSDHKQRRFYAPGEGGNGPGRTPWREPYIIYPNEQGKKVLSQNGYATYTSSENAATQQGNPPSAPSPTYKPLGEEAPNPLDEETRKTASVNLTRDLQSERKAVVQGSLSFEGGGTYHFGSGRPDDPNFPSTPLGSSEVGELNRHRVPGKVGYEMPALNNRFDPKVGRTRNGMVIHSSGHDDLERLYSHGCISIPKSEFPGFQQEMENFKKAHGGKAYINIMPDGRVTVTAEPAYSSDGTPMTPMSTDQAVKEIQTNQPQVVQSATQVATGDIKPLSSVTQSEGPINAAGPATPVEQTAAPQASPEPQTAPTAAVEAPKPVAPTETPAQPTPEASKAAPTAAVEAPKPTAQPVGPTPERYNVNVNKFTDAIRQTEDFKRQAGMFGSMVPNSTIINGFNDDPRVKAAGVRLDEKGVMHFTKGMTPDVKEVMSTFDTKSFMTKIEEKKKEDVSPTKVKAMADGGKVPVNTEQITAYPIGGLRGDNAVVVNAHQKPLFTMNTNEDVLMDPDNNRAQVIPNKKGTNVGPMPRQNMSSGIMEDFNSTIQEIRKDFANLKADKATKPDLTPVYPTVVENQWLNKLSHTADDPFKSPSARRVAYRAGGMETGEPHSGFHHSRGNNS